MSSKVTMSPGSHYLVKGVGAKLASTNDSPSTISSFAARILQSDKTTEVQASVSGSAVSGESDTWSVTFTASHTGNMSEDTDYFVETTMVADSLTRIEMIPVRATSE